MLVGFAVCELPYLFCADVDDKDMQPLVVIETSHAFTSIRLIEVARDNHGIAARGSGVSPRRRRNECHLFAIRRPRRFFSCARQRTVRAFAFREKGDLGAVRSCHEQTALLSLM